MAAVQVVAASRAENPVPVASFGRPKEGPDETALQARCLEKLARFKVPERIVVVEAFPIVDSPNGPKVQRVRLREMAELLLREQRHNQLRDVPIGLSQS